MADSRMAALMLESARRDILAFDRLAPMSDMHDSILGFHAQQAVEKCLKAVLFKHDAMVPRTHDLDELLHLLASGLGLAVPHADQLDELNPFAVQARYSLADLDGMDRVAVGLRLHDVLEWADGSLPA